MFFHQRNLKKAIKIDTVDSSSGVLLPFYDHDTRIVYLAGKVGFKVTIMCISSQIDVAHTPFVQKFGKFSATQISVDLCSLTEMFEISERYW